MGAFEEAKGKAKEAAGDLTDNPELRREGQAQEDKAQAEQDATRARAEAKRQEASADERERAERAAQAEK